MSAKINEIESQKNSNRYFRLLITMSLWIVYNVTIFQFYLAFPSQTFFLIFSFSFAILGMGVTWMMYSMIKNFSSNKTFIRFIFSIFFISFWAGIFASNPLDPLPLDSVLYKTLGSINQLGSFLSFITITILMVNDVFAETHTTGYRLLGASCIFLNIGIVFSFIYGVVNLLIPNSMGLNAPADLIAYVHCLNYSYYLLANMDSVYENANGIIKSVGIIQSILANLYVVLLIGRLLSR